MRTDPNIYTNVNNAIQQSEQSLETAMNQLSSGKRVAKPSDDPLAFAQNLENSAASVSVDRYTKNTDAVLTQAQQADSALSDVVTSLTQSLSIGTEAGGPTTTATQRAGLAQQVQGLMSDVLAQANLTVSGTALFGGTSGTLAPFVADASAASGYSYAGNSESNQATVGEDLRVPVNLPGDAIFMSSSGNVLGSLQQMVSAVQSGSASDLASASAAITAAISHIGEVRASYGSTVAQLNAQNSVLEQDTVSLTSQQTSLVDVDIATAATNLSQAQTANSAVLAMAAKILPESLLNYLH